MERSVRELVEDWQLTPDGEPWRTGPSSVVPVVTAEGARVVLKVRTTGDPHEHLALQHWHGRGAVQLLRADPRRGALLLERLHREDLSSSWDVEACATVAGLYADLHRPAPPQLATLSSYAARVAERLAALPRGVPLPPRFVDQARSLARSFAGDPATDGTLVHTDLHYGNVLAADRGPWLAIDPKPMSGDPHYELAPLLWHRYDELAGRVREGVRARFHAVVDVAGLDERRARDWVVVRMLDLARQRLEDPAGTPRQRPAADLLTLCVAIAKAVQD